MSDAAATEADRSMPNQAVQTWCMQSQSAVPAAEAEALQISQQRVLSLKHCILLQRSDLLCTATVKRHHCPGSLCPAAGLLQRTSGMPATQEDGLGLQCH